LDKDYEGLHLFVDKASGMRAAIAVHNTVRGPALGGTRFIAYANEALAIEDVLRLARGMSYKSALADIPFGGGKGVILAQPCGEQDRTSILHAYARAVESLGGTYITTEDSGTSQADMDTIRQHTAHVVGVSSALGGSGDPSPSTGRGVFRGIEAAARVVLGRSDLQGLRVAIQGAGNVATHLARELARAGAQCWISDLVAERAERLALEVGGRVVPPNVIHAVECEVFSPNALGGALNDSTIAELNCRIVAGGANNQHVDEPLHARALRARGVAYCPDYAINSGGVIQVGGEHAGWSRAEVAARVERIYDTIYSILDEARSTDALEVDVANRVAESRLARRR
jgi:leucine dehydrogenase